MIRKASIIGIVALGLALEATPGLVSSARHFAQCFRRIQDTSNALDPIERLVFGLVLANSNPPQRHDGRDAAPAPRT
jgi:hypothetical protein